MSLKYEPASKQVDLLRLNLERDLTRRAACTDESEVGPFSR